MNMKRSLYNLIIIIIIIYLTACSSTNRFKTAHNFFLKQNYVAAIQQYDLFLQKTSNGALATRAELERSQSYFQLGIKAYQNDNFLLASRLFFLSNNDEADDYLDDCYYKLAKRAYEQDNIEETLDYYGKIISYLDDSVLLPEVLYNRIRIFSDLDQRENAFKDYELLWSGYPESRYIGMIEQTILPIFQSKLDKAKFLKNKGDLNNTLVSLFDIYNYPTSLKKEIAYEISDVYFLMAQNKIELNDILGVKEYFEKTLEYNPERESEVESSKTIICNTILKQGKEFEEDMEIAQAITKYTECFILIPEYDKAVTAIQDAEELERKYNESLELNQEAALFESKKEFASALGLYRRSYEMFPVYKIKNKIFELQNIIRAEKDPKTFATSIVQNYRNGLITQKITEIEQDMIEKYGEEMVETSGWKALYSTGEYKYEVRYDIMTPKENFYFIWLVNLKNKEISPLNKLTESILL